MYISRPKYATIIIILCIFLTSCGTKETVILTKEDHDPTLYAQKESEQPKEETESGEKKNIKKDPPEKKEMKEEPVIEELPVEKVYKQQAEKEVSSTEKTEQVKETQHEKAEESSNQAKIESIEKKNKPTTSTAEATNVMPVKGKNLNQTNKKIETNKNKETTEKASDSNVQKKQIPNTTVSTINALLPQANSEQRTTPITHVVTHFMSNASNNPKNPYKYDDIRKIFIDYGVSAHYLIGRNGEIYQLVNENRVAYHAGKGNLVKYPQYKDKLNSYSIGIEIMAIGTEKEMKTMLTSSVYKSISKKNIGYTDAQYRSLKQLLEDILKRNPSIKRDRTHVIGHDEYAPGRKTDPGSLFNWSKLGL